MVYVDSTPYLPALTSNSPVCTGDALNMTATSSTGAAYSWKGPNSFTSLVQNPTINPATTAASGVYSVAASYSYVLGGPKTCISDTATMIVVVDSTPAVPLATSNSPGVPSVCQGDTLLLFSSDATGGVNFVWSGPNVFSSSLQNPMITPVTPAATGQYTVTATLGTSCVASAVITVSITPTPYLSATSNSPVCTGTWDTLVLQANSNPGATYWWTGPYTFRSAQQSPFRTPVSSEYAGIYKVTAYVNGCPSPTIDDTVEIRKTPDPPMVPWLT
jgi:hypothetical protein